MGGGIGKLGESTVPESCYRLQEGAVPGCWKRGLGGEVFQHTTHEPETTLQGPEHRHLPPPRSPGAPRWPNPANSQKAHWYSTNVGSADESPVRGSGAKVEKQRSKWNESATVIRNSSGQLSRDLGIRTSFHLDRLSLSCPLPNAPSNPSAPSPGQVSLLCANDTLNLPLALHSNHINYLVPPTAW